MNLLTETRNPTNLKAENRKLRHALVETRDALKRAVLELELKDRLLSNATDKQILLLNEIIAMNDTTHLNSAGNLPPVACPLLIEIAPDRLVRAERPTAVANRGDDLTYQLTDGNVIHGKLRWTYP